MTAAFIWSRAGLMRLIIAITEVAIDSRVERRHAAFATACLYAGESGSLFYSLYRRRRHANSPISLLSLLAHIVADAALLAITTPYHF